MGFQKEFTGIVPVILTPVNDHFPTDNTLISCIGFSTLVIQNVKRKSGATGIVNFVFFDRTSKPYPIEELLSIDIELTCVGFQFLSPGITNGQELKFVYSLFH